MLEDHYVDPKFPKPPTMAAEVPDSWRREARYLGRGCFSDAFVVPSRGEVLSIPHFTDLIRPGESFDEVYERRKLDPNFQRFAVPLARMTVDATHFLRRGLMLNSVLPRSCTPEGILISRHAVGVPYAGLSKEAKARAAEEVKEFQDRVSQIRSLWPEKIKAVRRGEGTRFIVGRPGKIGGVEEKENPGDKLVPIRPHWQQLWKWPTPEMPDGFKPTQGDGQNKDWLQVVYADHNPENFTFDAFGEIIDCYDPVVLLAVRKHYWDDGTMNSLESFFRGPIRVRLK